MKNVDVLFIHPHNFEKFRSYLKLPSLAFYHMSAILNHNNYTNIPLDFSWDDTIDHNLVSAYNPKIVPIYSTVVNHIALLEVSKKIKTMFLKSLMSGYNVDLYNKIQILKKHQILWTDTLSTPTMKDYLKKVLSDMMLGKYK